MNLVIAFADVSVADAISRARVICRALMCQARGRSTPAAMGVHISRPARTAYASVARRGPLGGGALALAARSWLT